MAQQPRVPETGDSFHTFVIRIWPDTVDRPWRATVKHVQRSDEHHFASIERLLIFVASRADPRDGA
jgi:hypothetical protein